jgi:hypothetical protein
MSLLIALHDQVGARALGDAINFLDREGKNRRINRVRYYALADFQRALVTTLKDPAKKKIVADLLGEKARANR